MYHEVFFNTERRDIHPYASHDEGAGRKPLRGDYWRLQNGTLGAAMRLKALSQTPPKVTGHPKTSRQPKNKQKPEQNNQDPYN